MSSSTSSVELAVWQRGRRLGSVTLSPFDDEVEGHIETAVSAEHPIDLAIASPVACDLRIGARTLAVVAAGGGRIANLPLRDLFGEIEIRADLRDDGDGPPRSCRLQIFVEGLSATVAAYETLMADLERLQPRLLREVGGPLTLQRGRELRSVDPAEEARRLKDWVARFSAALARIEARPFETLAALTMHKPWRPGDVLASDIADVLTADGTRLRGRQLAAIGTVPIRELHRSLDVPEHRHLHLGVDQLRTRARALRGWCTRVLDAYEVDRQRWGGREDSVDEQRNGPRRILLRTHVKTATTAEKLLIELAARSRVLREAPAAAGALRPTPLWLSRPDYRQAFDVLRELHLHGGGALVGDEFRIQLRGLDQLFEYWCFARTLLAVAAAVGRAVDSTMFELIDDVYRPDLRPGLVVRFARDDGARIAVAYEPGFPAAGRHPGGRDVPGPFRSVLGTGDLRPDIVVRLDAPGEPARLLVLDAKNKTSFGTDALFEASDYRSRIVDPVTGLQPARWMVFLHRDATRPLLENVTGLLAGQRGDRESWYLAGICVLPDQAERLGTLVQRFLAPS